MRYLDFGRILLGLGLVGLGVLSYIFGKFALQWQPVPDGLPHILAYGNGAILLVGGGGLLLSRRTAAPISAFSRIWP